MPRVGVVYPEKGEMSRNLEQTGTVEAFLSARLNAWVSGYLKVQKVDRGSKVKALHLVQVLEQT